MITTFAHGRGFGGPASTEAQAVRAVRDQSECVSSL